MAIPTINELAAFLESQVPLRLAEQWDNVGLLVGDRTHAAERVMTCLTVTPESTREAVKRRANLIMTHHPLPFKALQRITSDSVPGQLLLELIAHRIAVYSPHTAFDSAAEGINQQLSTAFPLHDIRPLIPIEDDPDGLGAGRYGRIASGATIDSIAQTLKSFLHIDQLQCVGRREQPIQKIALACGSGGSFLAAADRNGCDLLITGEATFHTCLDAAARGIGLLLTGHYASERFACENLAQTIQSAFADATVWACESERDPLSCL